MIWTVTIAATFELNFRSSCASDLEKRDVVYAYREFVDRNTSLTSAAIHPAVPNSVVVKKQVSDERELLAHSSPGACSTHSTARRIHVTAAAMQEITR
jgi:hypothetical protein